MATSSTPTQPALVQLQRDFNAHIGELRGGIESSHDLVVWLHRASVLTLGATPSDTLTGLTQGAVAHAILLGPTATKPRRDEQELSTDKHVRRRVEDYIFTPIFRAAYRELATDANEYLDEEPPELTDHSDARPPALRPAIRELEADQRDVLDRYLAGGGMESREALSDWMRDLVSATRGHIGEDFLDGMAGTDRVLRSAALGERFEEDVRRRYQQWVAAHRLLPAFNAAIRDLSNVSGEVTPEKTRTETHGDSLNV